MRSVHFVKPGFKHVRSFRKASETQRLLEEARYKAERQQRKQRAPSRSK